MGDVIAHKKGKKQEQKFETASINGRRNQASKCGFLTKKEALEAGHLAKA